MDDTTQRVAISCPACSPNTETAHEVLSEGGDATVRCMECSHVHKEELTTEETVHRDVIVSQDGESFSATVEAPAEETLSVGEEFLLETDEAVMTVRITSLELDQGRTENAEVGKIETIWTRAVGNVSVNVTAHPKSGAHDETRGIDLHVPGDYEFVVGEKDELSDEEFTVEGILIRDDAHGYEHEKLDYDGDTAVAKDVKRLYVRDESTTAWSAW